MKINIVDKNFEKINAALKNINGKSTSHTFNDVSEFRFKLKGIKQNLLDIIGSQLAANLSIIEITSSSPVSSSYKHTRIANKIIILYKNKNFYIIDILRISIFPDQGGTIKYYLTAEQDEIAVKKLRKKYNLQPRGVGPY